MLISEGGNGAIVAVYVSVTRFSVILDIVALRSFVRGKGGPIPRASYLRFCQFICKQYLRAGTNYH